MSWRRHPEDREIVSLAVPALGALVAPPLYLLADTAIVGHLGTESLAGLAVASVILTGIFSLFIGLAYGTTAAVSRLLGAGRDDEAAEQAVQSLWLSVALGIAVVLVVLATGPTLISAIGPGPAAEAQAEIYLRIAVFGVPGMLIVYAGTGYLRGTKDTRTPLVVAVATAAGNLVLELVLVEGLGYGIGASALSTAAAESAAGIAYVVMVLRAVRSHAVGLRPRRAVISTLARAGADLVVRTLALRGALTLVAVLAARRGAVDAAAHEIAFAVVTLLALALDALAIAGQAMVGHALGAGDAERARSIGDRLLAIGVAVGVVFATVVIAGRSAIVPIFSPDPEVVALAAFVLWFVAVLQPIHAVAFVLDGLLIGAGDMGFLARSMAAVLAITAAAAAVVTAAGFGLGGLWAAVVAMALSRCVLLGVRWRNDRWAVIGATTTAAPRRPRRSTR